MQQSCINKTFADLILKPFLNSKRELKLDFAFGIFKRIFISFLGLLRGCGPGSLPAGYALGDAPGFDRVFEIPT